MQTMTAQLEKSTQVLLTPVEALALCDELSVPYWDAVGGFTFARVAGMSEILTQSLAAHRGKLTALVAADAPFVCRHCSGIIRQPEHLVLWRGGEWRGYHRRCAGHAPDPTLQDLESYTVNALVLGTESKDDGLCAICTQSQALYPARAPNLCRTCWEGQQARKGASRASLEAAECHEGEGGKI